jgi:ABC-type nitrate/sulfonate/bicarbonate transport system substrate-binding protein
LAVAASKRGHKPLPQKALPADTSTQSNAAPITIGYSDWPGWVAWDIADQQGFFKKRGVNVKLVWFPVYTDSLNALAAGQVDANGQTWSDTMGPLSKGMDLKAVLVNDNSFGNDALIAQPGIKSVKELKGKRVATELGTVDHFLLLKALEANGMTEKDIQFVPIAVQDCPPPCFPSASMPLWCGSRRAPKFSRGQRLDFHIRQRRYSRPDSRLAGDERQRRQRAPQRCAEHRARLV